MSPELAGLLGIITGSLLTGIFSVGNTIYVERKERRRQRQKDAMEGLMRVHDGLTEIAATLGRLCTHAMQSIVSGNFKELESLPATEKATRLRYELTLWAPEMISEYERIEQSGRPLMNSWADSIMSIARGERRKELVDDLISKMYDHQKAVTDFQVKLAEFAAKRYLSE